MSSRMHARIVDRSIAGTRSALAALLCVAGPLLAASLVAAQPSPGPTPQAPAPPPAPAGEWLSSGPWDDCSRIEDPSRREAMAHAAAVLDRVWLAARKGRFARYTMPGEVRNPFDRTPAAATPPEGPRDGTVEIKSERCLCRFALDGRSGHVRYVTPFYRFHEAGPGWSPPLRSGVVMEIALALGPSGWQATDARSETAILLPEQRPRRPAETDLPPDAPWAEPVPGCGRTRQWTGEACVPRRR